MWRQRNLHVYGLIVAVGIMLVIFLLWPIVLTVKGGFADTDGQFTLTYIRSVFRDPLMLKGLGNSLLIATCTTTLCFLIALPLAVIAARCEFPGKAILSSLILVPLVLPPFVGAIGLRALLGRFGAFNALLAKVGLLDPLQPGFDFLGNEMAGGRFGAVVIAEALHLYPILYLNLIAALANLDPTLEEAALNLGAGRWRRLTRITLPLILPGVFAGATIVFIWSLTELGTPLMFDFYTVTPVQIFFGIQEVQSNPRPYALVVVMLLLAVGLYFLGRFAFGGRAYAMQSKASISAGTIRLTGWTAVVATGIFAAVTLLATLPHVGVVLSSLSVNGAWYRSVLPTEWTLSHYDGALTHDLAMGSIRNSLIYAGTAMLLCMVLGLAVSYLTVRIKVKGGWILDSLCMLPLAVPGLVMAFGYVAMSLSWPFPQLAAIFREHGMEKLASLCQVTGSEPDPLLFLVVAYAIRRLPYVVRSASAGLEQTSSQLEEAAVNLGASRFKTIRRIVLPLIAANLIAGGILAFSLAMLEVSDSLILAQKANAFPITKAIYALFNRLGDGPYIASAMGVWAMALLCLTLVGASLLMGKRLGAMFRV